MDLFGDGLASIGRDLRKYETLPLATMGINKNPFDKDEIFFITDAGMGYGDIIRVCYYAQRIAQVTGFRRCKVIFTILKVTKAKEIYAKDDIGPEEREAVVFRWTEEKEKIKKIKSYFENDLSRVKIVVHPMDTDWFGERAYPNVVSFLLPTRTLAVTSWLGVPQLRPNLDSVEGNHIAVWTTEKNLTPVAKWKDPLGWEDMEKLFSELEQNGHKIRRVSYRDDIEYVFETIRTAKMCIGYEGMGNLISQQFRKPILVFSENTFHSKVTSGMWARVKRDVSTNDLDIDNIIEEQKELLRSEPPRRQILSKNDIEYFGALDEEI